jgi:hypothetical protein
MGHVCLRVCLVTVAAVGMNLFGSVKYGQFLSRDANFSTFYLSMLTLFRYHLLFKALPLWSWLSRHLGHYPHCLQWIHVSRSHSTTTACCWCSLCVRDLVFDSCAAVGLTCFGPLGFCNAVGWQVLHWGELQRHHERPFGAGAFLRPGVRGQLRVRAVLLSGFLLLAMYRTSTNAWLCSMGTVRTKGGEGCMLSAREYYSAPSFRW